MVAMVLSGLLLMGVAVALALRAFAAPRVSASDRLSQINEYGFRLPEQEAAPHAKLADALDETAGRLGQWAARHLGSFREDDIRRQLTAAGVYNLTPTAFLGYRVISAIGLPALVLWLASVSDYNPVLAFLVTILAVLGGWVGPMTYLRKRIDRRFDRIETALPELIDLLVLTVEAGVGFNASLHTAASRMRGPLGDELRLTLQEQKMGLSLNAALSNLMNRCDTVSMRSFVRSVIQGETLGVSIGTILRNLATEMRKRRRARAEERAQKAPIKILFPLVFLIFPSMFVVVLYPAVRSFTSAFGG